MLTRKLSADMQNRQLAEVPPPIQHESRPCMRYGLVLVHVQRRVVFPCINVCSMPRFIGEGCLLFPLAPFENSHRIRPCFASNFFFVPHNRNPSGKNQHNSVRRSLLHYAYPNVTESLLADADDPKQQPHTKYLSSTWYLLENCFNTTLMTYGCEL